MIRRFLRSAGRASLHVTAALSLLLFVAVAAMWVRAHWRQDVVRLSRSGEVVASGDAGAGADAAQRAFAVRSLSFHQGYIIFQAYRMNVPDEAREESSIAWGRWRPEHHNYPPHGLGDWPGRLPQELWYWHAQATPPPAGEAAGGRLPANESAEAAR